MKSKFEGCGKKNNDFDHLEAAIKTYSYKKVLGWLNCKMMGEQMTDYEWILHCVKWEVAMHGEIQHGKNSEGKHSKVASISK